MRVRFSLCVFRQLSRQSFLIYLIILVDERIILLKIERHWKLIGYKQGELGRNHFQTCQNGTSEKSSLEDIAKELNMSKRNLQRALRIERNLTDSMKELLDTGEITKTFASKSTKTKPPLCVFHPFSTQSYIQAP